MQLSVRFVLENEKEYQTCTCTLMAHYSLYASSNMFALQTHPHLYISCFSLLHLLLCHLVLPIVLLHLHYICITQGRCNREKPPCKYYHPPQHLKDQLLINGRNHLALKNALLQQMPLLAGQMPVVSIARGPSKHQPTTQPQTP